MNNYLIYKHTSPSGKSYIGQTNNYKRRCALHKNPTNGCRAFANAIKTYGWDNFTHEILHENLSIDRANKLEAMCILEHNTLSPNGYNLKIGGLNTSTSQETRAKMSLAQKGRIHSQETRDKISLANKNMSQETRDKLSLAAKNRIISKETRAKMVETMNFNAFKKLKQRYSQTILTENNYSAGKLANILSTNRNTIVSYLNPTTRNHLGHYVIQTKQIHNYFNQQNPYVTL